MPDSLRERRASATIIERQRRLTKDGDNPPQRLYGEHARDLFDRDEARVQPAHIVDGSLVASERRLILAAGGWPRDLEQLQLSLAREERHPARIRDDPVPLGAGPAARPWAWMPLNAIHEVDDPDDATELPLVARSVRTAKHRIASQLRTGVDEERSPIRRRPRSVLDVLAAHDQVGPRLQN